MLSFWEFQEQKNTFLGPKIAEFEKYNQFEEKKSRKFVASLFFFDFRQKKKYNSKILLTVKIEIPRGEIPA